MEWLGLAAVKESYHPEAARRRILQAALGHADLKTISIYVQLARKVMKRELQEHAL